MSVRRLAEEQPESFAFTPENEAWCEEIMKKYPEGREASAVISLLWLAQKQNDYWLPKPAIETVARMLGMPYIRVLEIATFYTMFNLAPVGTILCPDVRHDAVPARRLRCDQGDSAQADRRARAQVTADGVFSWREVECLGACCNAPMVQINEDLLRGSRRPGISRNCSTISPPAVPFRSVRRQGRVTSEPAGGLTSLTTLYGADGRTVPCAHARLDTQAR